MPAIVDVMFLFVVLFAVSRVAGATFRIDRETETGWH
jgi:hypothetical protein